MTFRSFPSSFNRFRLFVGVFGLLAVVNANFKDYVDPTYDCPATTTCPQVCVASFNDCPVDMRCASNQELCVDGSCSSNPNGCVSNLNNPCEFACAPTACARVVIDFYDSCLEKFQTEYQDQEACQKMEEEAVEQNSFRHGVVIFFYCWLGIMTLTIGIWCAYNQRWRFLAESIQSLDEADDGKPVNWQSGYQTVLTGNLIYYCTVLTLFGFQIILMACTISYYIHQDTERARVDPVFDNERQVLQAFEVTWMLGFLWSYALKWPYSIRSLFYRRCTLGEATHVSVLVPYDDDASQPVDSSKGTKYIVNIQKWIHILSSLVNRCMAFLFSERARHAGKVEYCSVETDTDRTRFFVFNFRRYNYDDASCKFAPGVWLAANTIGDFDKMRTGLAANEVEKRRRVVGPNSIEMKPPSFLRSISEEFTKPFYTYQNYMVWTWLPLWYYYMALIHGSVILAGGLAVSLFRYRNDRNLYKLSHISGHVEALRDGALESVPQKELVPGDVVVVTSGITYCDMVLVSSHGVLVDESALTGESNPVAKTALDPSDGAKKYDPLTHKRHSISAGTSILESEGHQNLAVVTSTGSFTTKGELLRSIFAYQRYQFKFDVEVGLVIGILFFYAIFGFAMVVYFIKDTPTYAWFYGMYVVATVLPPLLPTVFTVSVGISDNRLAKKQIACTNSEGILVAGKVKRAFFDKTGTLTKQGLDFLATRCMTTWDADEPTDLSDDMAIGMAACHSLTRFESGVTVGNPVDRVMFEASGASFVDTNGGTRLIVTDCKGNRLEVVKHFDFDHHRMTQSTIVKTSDGRLIAIAKGSGESIKKVCLPDSLPRDFEAVARSSAKSGIYQISMATKVISAGDVDLSQMPRSDIEKDLVFAGVVNFKNVIRKETWDGMVSVPVVFASSCNLIVLPLDFICQLEAGEVKTVMVTGDSMLTGVCIARESGMIKAMQPLILGSDFDSNGEVIWVDESDAEVDLPSIDTLQASNTELAVTGEVWQSLRQADPKMAMELAEHIRVYGRCTPFDKVSVVSTFVELGYITLMCGDGGNDCGALKTAHVGVALSDAEASMVSPFTSLDKSITSVVEVVKEGRCALASALASYKYLIMYGQIEALTQIMNAYFKISFSEWCWAVLDGVYPISMAFSLPNSKAASSLAPSRPTSSLLGPHTLASALGVLALHFVFTVIALITLFRQDWFQCRKWDRSDVSDVLVIGDNYEAQTLFLVTACQYISTAMAYNFGYEWRQSWIRNYVFVTLATAFMAMQFYITLVPGKMSCFWRVNCDNDHVLVSVVKGEKVPIQNPFNTTVMPVDFRWSLIAIIVANTLAVIAWDYFVVNGTRKKLGARKRQQAQVSIGATKTLSDNEADTIV